MHMERTPYEQITATLTFHWHIPDIAANDYLLIVPHPPVLHSQANTICALTVEGTDLVGGVTDELSDLHRHIVRLHITADDIKRYPSLMHDVPIRVAYQAVLYREWIAPGLPTEPVPALDPVTRGFALALTKGNDFNALVFQQWLDTNGLRRKSNEADIDFAWRAFSFIKQKYFYHYNPKQDRAASKLCQTDNSDCGGLSDLFISTLRANGIPARILIGRVALTAGPNDLGQCHAEADFFANGIGWVPVNIAPAVGAVTRSPYMDFGRFNGDFIAFHVDNGMIFGKRRFDSDPLGNSVGCCQGIWHWIMGSGQLSGMTQQENWQVTSRLL